MKATYGTRQKTPTNVIRMGAIATKNSLTLEYRTMLEVVVEEERVYMYQDIFYQWYYIFGKMQWILKKCNIYYSMDMNS